MKDLRLAAHSGSDEEPVVDGGTLLIGPALMGHCLDRRVITARALLSAFRAFPGSFDALGWSAEDAVAFERRLVKVLTGMLPDEVLNPPRRPAVGMGVPCQADMDIPTDAAVVLREDFRPDVDTAKRVHELLKDRDRAARFAEGQRKIVDIYADTFRQLAESDDRGEESE